ncbi:MAG: hypothetical protein ABEJ42_01910 [Halobacteriaceae archaeon]
MPRSRTATLALCGVLAICLVAAPVAASLSTATAEDVVVGLPEESQTVSISGQVPTNGETDYYVLELAEFTRSGAEIRNVTFRNVGGDGDALAANGVPRYYPGNGSVTLQVTEDPADLNKQVDFDVVLEVDTSDAVGGGQFRYEVKQFDTTTRDEAMSPQAAQFRLIGAQSLTARTSSQVPGAAPVTHTGTMTLPTRERGVIRVVVNTSGANYGGLSHGNATVRVNGGADLVTGVGPPPAVSSDGDGVILFLDREVRIRVDDQLTVRLDGVRNPGRSGPMTVSLRTGPGEVVFAATDELEINPRCEDVSTDAVGSSCGLSPQTLAGTALGLLAGAVSVFLRTRSRDRGRPP